MLYHAVKNCVVEWSYTSQKIYTDPFNQVNLDVVFTDPQGKEYCQPAFWSGDNTWRVRYAPALEGTYQFRSVCSDPHNVSLHGIEGTLVVSPYQGSNPLLQHGHLRLMANRRHLEHADGTPFFWLGDTWWMGFCKRLKYPEDFQELTADRVKKGFTLIQLVAGMYPDMDWMDERGANEAGFPWEKGFARINPAYFDLADIRLAHLIRSGLVPCITGQWGYFMDFAGIDVLKKHWRYLIARWGAYPVVWCVTGEALMDYYLAEKNPDPAEHLRQKQARWSELIQYIRKTDPSHNPITIHNIQENGKFTCDPQLLDLGWLSTGHAGHTTLIDTIDMLLGVQAQVPGIPLVVDEANYEGIMESSREEVQRFLFWSCMLSGALGHTYGANGIWQVNETGKPYGPSPHGLSWGDTPWNEAYRLPGSNQMGLGRKLLERYPWWEFESHPEWIEPNHTQGDRISCYAAGIPGKVRVIFYPHEISGILPHRNLVIKGLEKDITYRVYYYNPKDGREYQKGVASGDAQGEYIVPKPSIFQDWVLVLERTSA
jgi:hypothetical protein